MVSVANFNLFGTNLPTLELGEVSNNKTVNIQDQIVTDENGRRRFHGAFTGGFSAGYWNTVGSKEGWTTQSYKSSRSEKSSRFIQKPEDFMDEEDCNEFGKGSKFLSVNDNFENFGHLNSGSQKRKTAHNNYGPIPGEPVLKKIVKCIRNTISVRILQKWGWRSGQGIGPRQTTKEKKMARVKNLKEQYLFEKYGCELLESKSNTCYNNAFDDEHQSTDSSNEDDFEDRNITFAPEDYDMPPCNMKNDNYGMGYESLKNNFYNDIFSRKSQFDSESNVLGLPKTLEMLGKHNNKISFSGHAFGIGALEEDDDDDVYSSYDMTNYDFSLDDKKTITKKVHNCEESNKLVLDFFIIEKNNSKYLPYTVEVPIGWQPKKWFKHQSRFEPLSQERAEQLEKELKLLPKNCELNREEKTVVFQKPEGDKIDIQGELKIKTTPNHQQDLLKENKIKTLMEKTTIEANNLAKDDIINMDGKEIQSNDITYLDSSDNDFFQPFANDTDKQTRYEKFLFTNISNDKEIDDFISNLQPKTMTAWESRLEMQEFKHAKKLYKSTKNITLNGFIRETGQKEIEQDGKKDLIENKEIVAVRTKDVWKPHSTLCKRYNIPDPYVCLNNKDFKGKKSTKLNVFNYLGESFNRKDNFESPIIIPKYIEESASNLKEKEMNTGKLFSQELPNEEKIVNSEKRMINDSSKNETISEQKSELEQTLIHSMDKLINEKQDLFSSIFQDDESDCEETKDAQISENNETNNKSLENKFEQDDIGDKNDDIVSKNMQTGGIFKWLFVKAPKQSQLNNKSEEGTEGNLQSTITSKKQTENQHNINKVLNVYGPSLPKEKDTFQSDTIISESNWKNEKLVKHKFGVTCVDEWIEKKPTIDSSTDLSSISDCESKRKKKSLKKSKKKSKKKKKSDHNNDIEICKRKKHKKY